MPWRAVDLAGADPHSPLAAPLYADLTGLAPLLIQVGAAETLLDDTIRLAQRADAAAARMRVMLDCGFAAGPAPSSRPGSSSGIVAAGASPTGSFEAAIG